VREIIEQDMVVDGKVVRVTLINDPNIDDVLIGESQDYAYGLSSGTTDPERRVVRSVREIFLMFGVQR
jgi:hypothetical protein